MSLGSDRIGWADSLQYLGVTLTGERSLGFNCASLKQSFFAAFNCRLYTPMRSTWMKSQTSYGLSTITHYAVDVAKYTVRQEDEINAF